MSSPGVLNGVHRGAAPAPAPARAEGGPGSAPAGAGPPHREPGGGPAPGRPTGAGHRRHEVPTHLDVQDRLFLGLSSRQVAYVLIGLAGAAGLWGGWPQLPPPLRLALALACAGTGAALAFVRWQGHGLEAWAVIGLRYAVGPRRAVWRAGGGAADAGPPFPGAGAAPRGRPAGAAQGALVGLESIAGDAVHLSGGRWRAVLEVTGLDFELRRADEQEALVAAFGAFLNGLTFPIQALVRVQPVDLEAYLQRLEGHARRQLDQDLAILAHDHLTYLRRLGSQRALLERRCYVVVPADPALGAAPGPVTGSGRGTIRLPFRLPWRSRWGGAGGPARAPATRHAALAAESARRQLAFRCAEVARGLGRAGLGARRLDTDDLAGLLYGAWCPDLAGTQRLRQRVAAYTAPVVCGPGTARSQPPTSPPPPDEEGPFSGEASPWTAGGAEGLGERGGNPNGSEGASGGAPGGTGDAWRFARGTRDVADLIAPGAVEIARDHVRIDRHYLRTLAVTAYPRTVAPGWLAPLLYAPDPLELSLHLRPLASGEMVKALSHKLVQLHSSRLLDARGGRLADPEREVAYDDVERLRDALQRGEERVFATSLYLLLRAPTPEGLDEITRRTEAILDGILAQSRVAYLEQEGGLRACLPLADDRLLAYRNLDTSSLATTFPFSTHTLAMAQGVFYGVARHGQAPVIVDPFDASLENANTAVIATSGAGKSYSTKLIALRHHLLGVDILVVDPEDEYRRLCAAVGGQHVPLSATAPARLNPFDLPPPPGPAPGDPPQAGPPPAGATPEAPGEGEAESGADILAEQVLALVALVEIMVATPDMPLSAQERGTLDRALYATYAKAGISAERATHARPAPLLRDLYAVLQAQAPADATAAGLAGRLHRYVEGSLSGLFGGPTNVALDRPFVVFSIQRLEPELRPLAIHLITTFVWGRVRRARRPRLLVVDEAWSVLQYREGGAFLAGLARRARKYYLGLVTISQSVGDFLATEAGRAVLTNAALKLLLKQDGATVDRLVALFDLTAEERQFLLAAGKGEGLLLARGTRVALQVEGSATEHRLATTAPAEVATLDRMADRGAGMAPRDPPTGGDSGPPGRGR